MRFQVPGSRTIEDIPRLVNRLEMFVRKCSPDSLYCRQYLWVLDLHVVPQYSSFLIKPLRQRRRTLARSSREELGLDRAIQVRLVGPAIAGEQSVRRRVRAEPDHFAGGIEELEAVSEEAGQARRVHEA